MAKSTKVNYGTKKLVGRFEKDKIECDLPSSFEKIGFDPTAGIDGYLLIDNTKPTSGEKSIHINKCFCADCQKAFDVKRDVDGRTHEEYSMMSVDDRVLVCKDLKPEQLQDIECPECHKTMESISVITPLTNQPVEKNHVNKNGAWAIPETMTGRYLFQYEDENGKCTRLDDNIMTRSTIVYPSGKQFSYSTEYSQANDFIKHDRKMTVTDINGTTRTPRSIQSSIDVFSHESYGSMHREVKNRLNIIHFNDYSSYASKTHLYMEGVSNRMLTCNPDIFKDTIDPSKDKMYFGREENITRINPSPAFYPENEEAIRSGKLKHGSSHYIQDVKAKIIEKQFDDLKHPVMADSAKNGIYLTEHKMNSDETNTGTDMNKKEKYMLLMTKYPYAFEYAAERASDRITNFHFAQQRKAAADPSYVAKEATDKAKAKMMREEVAYVAEQLSTCDNKILKTIHDSKSLDDMKARLKAIALGDTSELDGNARIDVEHASGDKIKASKKLKRSFTANPIGTANTIYTCHKMGIKDINNVNKMIEFAENSPEINPAPVRVKGVYRAVDAKHEANRCADTIAPIQTKAQLRFIRSFAKSHGEAEMVDTYTAPEKFDLLNECISLYDTVATNATIVDGNTQNENSALLNHELVKNNLRNYLQGHPVTDAYIHYCEKFGKKTPETVNEFIAEIKFDEKLDDVKEYAIENGVDAACEKYKDDMKGISDPNSYLSERINNEDLITAFSKKQLLSTRNEKPLFENRTLRQIHDELSNMNQHLVTENLSLMDAYPKEILDMQKEYDAPDGSGTWSFKVHKDSFDVVRSATELHNCLGRHHVDNTLYGSAYTMYMENELGQRCAAIELVRSRSGDPNMKYAVAQFQADHDCALDKRYKDVALQWLSECNIDHKNNGNVKAFGTGIAFYGGGNADFHNQEIDEVENVVVQKDERKMREIRRIETAKKLYKWTPENGYDFGVEIPEYTPIKKAKSGASKTSEPMQTGINGRGNEREEIETPFDAGPNNGDFGDT